MMTFARIEGGIVMEVLRAEKLPPMHENVRRRFVVVPDDVAQQVRGGWTYDGTTFAAPPPDPAEAREAKLRELHATDARLIVALEEYLNLPAVRAQLSPESQALLALRARLQTELGALGG